MGKPVAYADHGKASAKRADASQKSLVSGIISAASDNDPTTIATLAIAGASTLYGLEWVLLLIVPMFAVVQAIATHLATVSHQGLQDGIRKRYGSLIAIVSLFCIVSVSVVTFAADLEAGAAALELLTHIAYATWLIPLAVIVIALMSLGTFAKIRRFLIVLPLAFVAYIAAAILAKPDWHAVLSGFIPHLRGDDVYVTVTIALMGTTLTTYTYLWQTIEVAADAPPRRYLLEVSLASIPGTILTGGILWFILVATAATLGVHHQHVQTAQDAAKALAPIAGPSAETVFAIGLLGSSLLALPVIAGGMANAICATFQWRGSLDQQPRHARRYYAALYGSIVAGILLTLAHVQPIALLFAASIAGGLATPVTLALLVALATDKRAMRGRTIDRRLAVAGWSVTGIAAVAALAFIRWH